METCQQKWYEKIFLRKKVYTYKLHPRDDAGAKVFENFRNMGLSSIANSVASAANHVENFFNQLQIELAFYISCLNLFGFLNNLNNEDIVGNFLDYENKLLFIIMGINKISVLYVTNMYQFAKYFIENEKVGFLEAKKDENAEVAFKIQQGTPANTNF